jgi:hypothetical protein
MPLCACPHLGELVQIDYLGFDVKFVSVPRVTDREQIV